LGEVSIFHGSFASLHNKEIGEGNLANKKDISNRKRDHPQWRTGGGGGGVTQRTRRREKEEDPDDINLGKTKGGPASRQAWTPLRGVSSHQKGGQGQQGFFAIIPKSHCPEKMGRDYLGAIP